MSRRGYPNPGGDLDTLWVSFWYKIVIFRDHLIFFVFHHFSMGILVGVVFEGGYVVALIEVSVWTQNDPYNHQIRPWGTHF